MSDRPVHPAVQPLHGFFGTFVGTGHGQYPTITPFSYQEQLTFTHRGAPVVAFSQATTSFDGARPMHHEAGFLRIGESGVVEMTVAHTFGITEVLTGTVDGNVLSCTSTHLGVAPAAKTVTGTRRRYVVTGDTLTYELWMSYAGHDDVLHLSGTLSRAD
jgi:hypothetical protein